MLVIASLENGWIDLAHSFFNMFGIVRIGFISKEKLEKLLGILENLGKLKVLISVLSTQLVKFSRKRNIGKVVRKNGKSGKTKSVFNGIY